MSSITEISVTFDSETKIKPVTKVRHACTHMHALLTSPLQFEDAGLHPVMLENIKLCGYEVPTPIQAYVLPSVLKNIDIIGIAQTGK